MPQYSRSESYDSGTGKRYTTQSRLESFCRCPEAFRRAYIEGERMPPGIAASKGTGVHHGAACNMKQKMKSHQDLPAASIVELSVAGFEEDVKDGVSLSVEDRKRGEKIVIAEAKDDVADMAEVHALQQAPDYQPVMVEQTVEIVLPTAEVNVRGTIDVGDDQKRVVDFKTSKRRKTQEDVDTAVQLTIYAAAYHAATGEPSVEQRYDTVVRTKTKTYRDVKSTTRGPDDYRALAHRINEVERAIAAGIFIPTTPGSWWCSPTWCGFYSTCRFVNSEREEKAEQ